MKRDMWLRAMLSPAWDTPRVAIAFVVAVALLWGIVTFLLFPPDPGPDTNNLPIYPGGHGLFHLDNMIPGSQGDSSTSKATYYWTDAKPELVIDFYKKTLPGLGWGPPTHVEASSVSFVYILRTGVWRQRGESKTIYLSIEAIRVPSSTGPDQTLVELSIRGPY